MKSLDTLVQNLEVKEPSENILAVGEDQFLAACRIRLVEEKFLELFAAGSLSGTVHTSVGQEFVALAVISHLLDDDWVTSNHRCHGHFIAKTDMWRELIAELLGDVSGVCKGVGGSQHLYTKGFLSNGTQGSLVPVASGMASALKIEGDSNALVASFIGEGTLGEGVVYEAMNISSLFELPHLLVCENNFYSQSTPQSAGVSGSIMSRANAFGIVTFEADIWDLSNLYQTCGEAIRFVRENRRPAFLNIQCYRLNPHSKGDDDRSKMEIEFFRGMDPLTLWMSMPENLDAISNIKREIDSYVDQIMSRERHVWGVDEYAIGIRHANNSVKRRNYGNDPELMVNALNQSYMRELVDGGAKFIGEDIADPYGGAFKVTKGFSSARPENVFSTPISEAGLVGFGIGHAVLSGNVYCEIMFGDFIANAVDQIVNNACKFFYMYAHQINVPIKIRVAMGAGRGYGPTHSQSLERIFFGCEGLTVFSPTSMRNPRFLINEVIANHRSPCLVVENKVDYGRTMAKPLPGLTFEEIGGAGGTLSVKPSKGDVSLTIVAYGGIARQIYDWYEQLFKVLDVRIELLVPQLICPIPLVHFERSVKKTRAVVVVEETAGGFGWGAEFIAQLHNDGLNFKSAIVCCKNASVPSPKALEAEVLPSLDSVVFAARRLLS